MIFYFHRLFTRKVAISSLNLGGKILFILRIIIIECEQQALASNDFGAHFLDVDFVVLGFPQSGTTSLVYYLDQHPDIYLSRNFEDNIFWQGNFTSTSFQRWRRQYPHKGDSVSYENCYWTVEQDDDARGYNSEDRFKETTNSIRKARKTTLVCAERFIQSTSTSLHRGSVVVAEDGDRISKGQRFGVPKNMDLHIVPLVYPGKAKKKSHKKTGRKERGTGSTAHFATGHRLRQEFLWQKMLPSLKMLNSSEAQIGHTSANKISIRAIGVKDPLLITSPEALSLLGERVKPPLRAVFVVRDPLEMIISWLQSGASWWNAWDESVHFGMGFLTEHIRISMEVIEENFKKLFRKLQKVYHHSQLS